MNIWLFLISCVLTNNFIFSKFLGCCPFLGVSSKVETAASMGIAVTFVMTLASLFAYMVNAWILVPLHLEYMQTIAFILVIASLVQFVEMFLKKSMPAIYSALGIYLPLITTNCAVLGVATLNVTNQYNMLYSVLNGTFSALGFLLDGCLDLCNLNGVLFYTLEAGDFFEIEPMFSQIQTILPWHLRARTNTVVTFLDKNIMLSQFEEDPAFARNYIHIRADYTQNLTRQLDHFTAASPGVALALYLLGNHTQHILKLPDGLAGLARRLNISRATLYRALADLERRQLVSHHEKTVRILDHDGLFAFAYSQSQPQDSLPAE